jgi:hypothetical protein
MNPCGMAVIMMIGRIITVLGAVALNSGCGTRPRTPPGVCTPGVAVDTRPAPLARYFIGGDARNDSLGVVPWAFCKAKERGARAFIFLGDMELDPHLDVNFQKELDSLDPLSFYPVVGNHEVRFLGLLGIERAEAERRFQKHFLGTKRTPVTSHFTDRVAYAVDLDGGVHFVALDNVRDEGFGKPQLDWLREDLAGVRNRSTARYVIVGMHKALAGNGASTHSMDEDGKEAARDSVEALKIFQENHVTAIFASHVHEYVTFEQGGIRTYITGGLGAPITRNLSKGAYGRHHVLEVNVRETSLDVAVLPFEGPAVVAKTEDDEGNESW